jgi:Predicted nucleic acid-binding protein, contains PIN domain
MKRVLVDSSIWIGYFRGLDEVKVLNVLIDNNAVCINEMILAELLPALMMKKENKLIKIMNSIERMKLEIDWIGITQMQVINLKNGINRVGFPDLIIAQNAIQNNVELFSLDKHFVLMKRE